MFLSAAVMVLIRNSQKKNTQKITADAFSLQYNMILVFSLHHRIFYHFFLFIYI